MSTVSSTKMMPTTTMLAMLMNAHGGSHVAYYAPVTGCGSFHRRSSLAVTLAWGALCSSYDGERPVNSSAVFGSCFGIAA